MWINRPALTHHLLLDHIFLCLVIMLVTNETEGCGTYHKIGGGGTWSIDTGTNYGPYTHCIWWFETDEGYRLHMNITYVGDYNFERCGDYVIIRDGNGDPDEILNTYLTNCTSLTNHVVDAYASWMRVQFISDGNTAASSRFQGHFYTSLVGASLFNVSSPIKNCRSYEWSCSNKECMTLSYRCDGFNDCGCTTDCDEDGCEGLGLSQRDLMYIGGFVGLGLFIIFFIFSFAYEIHLRRRTLLEDPKAQAELQKKAERKRKAALHKQEKQDWSNLKDVADDNENLKPLSRETC